MTITERLKKCRAIQHLHPVDAAAVYPRLYISDAASISGLIVCGVVQGVVWCTNDPSVPIPRKFIKQYGIKFYKLPSMFDMPFNNEQTKEDFFKLITRGRMAIAKMLQETTGNIVVNCSAGVNRSASVLAAWLLTRPKNPLTYKQVMQVLKAANAKRGWEILTNKHFRAALEEYPAWFKKRYR